MNKTKQKYEAKHSIFSMMRLQEIAKLEFLAADEREICVRKIEEIQLWQKEQKNK